MRRAFRILLSLLVIMAGAYAFWMFNQMNSEPLQLRFMIWRTREASTGLVIMLTFAAGMLLSAFLFFSTVLKANLEARRLEREAEALRRLVDERVARESKPVG